MNMGVFCLRLASVCPTLETHDAYLLPLLVILAVTVALVVLGLAERNTRNLVKL
jgi:putative exporter of polyketide antibiotics